MAARKRVRGRKRSSALGRKGTPHTTPMSHERRLASYGIRDPNTGAILRYPPTPAQYRRMKHKGNHARRANK